MKIERYHGEPRGLKIVFGTNPFEAYGIIDAEITDIVFCLKELAHVDSDDKFLKKTLINSEIAYSSLDYSFTIPLVESDYDNLKPLFRYEIVLGFKTISDTKYTYLNGLSHPFLYITHPKINL